MRSATPAIDPMAQRSANQKGGKKKIILVAAPLLLIVLGAGLWFGGFLPPLLKIAAVHGEKSLEAQGPAGKPGALKPEADTKGRLPVFVDLPDLVANLNVGQRRSSFIKLKAKLELARAEDQPAVVAAMPRLQDMFSTYLREMRPEELRGSAGTYRLREELIGRANIAVAPARIIDVLFSEMIVQ